MNIRLVSTLTADDEDRVAPLLLTTVKQVFQHLRIAYAVRIETAGGRLLEHSCSIEDMSAFPVKADTAYYDAQVRQGVARQKQGTIQRERRWTRRR